MTARTAIQRDLDRLFKAISCSDYNIREVTKSAFTQARAKLNAWAFVRLSEVAFDTFYAQAEIYTWYGFRVLAVDGSRLMLPNHPTIKAEFGEHSFGPKADSVRSMAMISMLYDVLNLVTIDARMDKYAASERDLLEQHLETDLKCADNLLLLDRGYPSINLLYLLTAKKIHFCIRMTDHWWLSVKDLLKSGEREKIVSFKLPKKDRKKLANYPEIVDIELKCRLLKIDLPDGKYEILCSSLTDMQTYKYDEFEGLYHLRWNEEESYKMLKSRVEVENFTGKTARAVRQDFFAKIFLMNLCAIYSHPIEEKVRAEYIENEQRKHAQKINRTHALATLRDILVPMFIRRKAEQSIKAFDTLVENTRELIRPERKVPRKKRPKKLYYMNYKNL